MSTGRRSPLLEVLAEADAAVDALTAATGLACPTGCGHCCAHHQPHATVADLAPMADAEVVVGTAEARLAALLAAGDDAPCVYFAAGRLPGGCTAYALRPLICRLFGFSAVRDKHGQPELAACHVHKRERPAAVARAVAHVGAGGPVAVMADLQAQADALDPDSARVQHPINRALRLALERALLRAAYADADTPPRP
ncbi:MAG: YkgJ family cysteine cluster protein [Kofleriaceae bacterium]|nr:YkgJ family cysteine cluster protein [Kofleriaceae bacterium]